MNGWDPQLLNGAGVVGMSVFFVIALMRGWIVTGKSHDAEIARYEKGREKDADTINILSRAVTEQTANDTVANRLLSSVRDIVAQAQHPTQMGGGS